ncbi:MAG: prepilin-type N-terminal cleavage/methylation domain-containing protein [Sulfurimonas sp.]
MKKAFSLIELMIVIVIIGVVYTLVITKLHNANDEAEKLSLKTLKSYLYKQIKDGNNAKMFCDQECQVCTVYVDGDKVAELEGFVDNSIEVYRYNYLQGLIPQEFRGCFTFEIGRNSISDQFIVAYHDKVYDFSEYFEGVKVYNSLEDLVAAKEQMIHEVQ